MLQNYFKFNCFILLVVGYLAGGAETKECYSCEGINCLRTSKANNKATCVDAMDSCVTMFEKFTVVARGCYSTLPEEKRNKCDSTGNAECHKCSQSLCNNKGAIYCLQCNSQNNKDCSTAVSKIESTRCPVSTSPNSYCYTRMSSNEIERGCLLDTSEQLKCLSDSSCEMCVPDGEDICNRGSDSTSGSKRLATYGAILLLVCRLMLTLL